MPPAPFLVRRRHAVPYCGDLLLVCFVFLYILQAALWGDLGLFRRPQIDLKVALDILLGDGGLFQVIFVILPARDGGLVQLLMVFFDILIEPHQTPSGFIGHGLNGERAGVVIASYSHDFTSRNWRRAPRSEFLSDDVLLASK